MWPEWKQFFVGLSIEEFGFRPAQVGFAPGSLPFQKQKATPLEPEWPWVFSDWQGIVRNYDCRPSIARINKEAATARRRSKIPWVSAFKSSV